MMNRSFVTIILVILGVVLHSCTAQEEIVSSDFRNSDEFQEFAEFLRQKDFAIRTELNNPSTLERMSNFSKEDLENYLSEVEQVKNALTQRQGSERINLIELEERFFSETSREIKSVLRSNNSESYDGNRILYSLIKKVSSAYPNTDYEEILSAARIYNAALD